MIENRVFQESKEKKKNNTKTYRNFKSTTTASKSSPFLYFRTSKTSQQRSIYLRVSILEVWLSLLSLSLSIIVEKLSLSSSNSIQSNNNNNDNNDIDNIHNDLLLKLSAFVSSVLCLLSVPITHGILGKVLHSNQWQFWQPFKGGRRFVMLQTLSWFSFAITLIVSGFFGYINMSSSLFSDINQSMEIEKCSHQPLDRSLLIQEQDQDTLDLKGYLSGTGIPGVWMGNGMMAALSSITMIVSLMVFEPYSINSVHDNVHNCEAKLDEKNCSHSSFYFIVTKFFLRMKFFSEKESNNNNNNNENNNQEKIESLNLFNNNFNNKNNNNNNITENSFQNISSNLNYRSLQRIRNKRKRKRRNYRLVFKNYTSMIGENLGQFILDLRMYIVVGIIYNLSTLLVLFLILPFIFLSVANAFLFLTTAFFLYLPTYLNDPASNGRREWIRVRSMPFLHDLARYFEGQIIRDFDASEIRNDRQYIFAMAPHGVYPITAFWSHHTSAWYAAFPQLERHRITILGADIFHLVPILRDVALWLGSRNVSRRTFDRTLNEGRSVFMVPGGVSEMKYSRSHSQDIVLLSRHQGFVKQAIKHGVDLVPVFSFGETRVIDTINIPKIHSWLLKRFQSPIPYFRGRFGLQFPRKERLAVVCAKPIQVPQLSEQDPNFKSQVEKIHKEFYQRLVHVFEKYKRQCNHENSNLILK